MPSTSRILAALGVVMLLVLAWRIIMGGPIGPKTYGFIACTAAVWVGWYVIGRRTPPATLPPRV